jgi:hypothetical protein
LPKPKPRQPSQAEIAARSRGMKGSQEMREAFGINDEFVRETVRVDSLPDPPGTEVIEAAQASHSRRATPAKVNVDEAVIQILREEAQEISIRFERFGISFPANMQQDLIDHVYSLLALSAQGLMVGGGAVARR